MAKKVLQPSRKLQLAPKIIILMTSVTLIKIILEQSKTSEKDALQSNFEENKKQTEKGFEFWICLQMPKKN
jgi:hypothetical protein